MGSIIEVFRGRGNPGVSALALRPTPLPGVGSLCVRATRLEDYAAIRALQRQAHPGLPAWTLRQLDSQRRAFPEGQIVADCGGEVVGAASLLVVKWDDYLLDQAWKHVTGDGFFTTHDPGGRTLFGAELVMNLARRGTGAPRALYLAQRRLCRKLNLRRVIVAARMPGYRASSESMSPDTYAQRVLWGDIDDASLRFAMSLGFQYCGVIRDYMPQDAESAGNAALFVWLNPLYSPTEPPANAERPRRCA